MEAALTLDVLATDLADYLVRKGVSLLRYYYFFQLSSLLTFFCQIPFRETHHISGRAVALAEARKVQLDELSLKDYQTLCPLFEEDVHKVVFDFEASVERRCAIGGTSKGMVERQIATLRTALGK